MRRYVLLYQNADLVALGRKERSMGCVFRLDAKINVYDVKDVMLDP